jgi:predicted nucleic acid-binding Zn finger protein
MAEPELFADLPALADSLRTGLTKKTQNHPDKSHFALIYAFNGTGKTRLSGAYRDLGKETNQDGEVIKRDTLYFNAFTEDLFWWDNDLENDEARVLELNDESKFFDGFRELEVEAKIEALLARYADFQFAIDYDRRKPATPPETHEQRLPPAVTFFRERTVENIPITIKVSRAEESIFVWCLFLAALQLALEGDRSFSWVEHVYIDDPISSLDEHNAIVVGNHLVELYREAKRAIPTVISTHHALFFNVMHYELKNRKLDEIVKIGEVTQYDLKKGRTSMGYVLNVLKGDTPQFYHVSALKELCDLAREGKVNTYHFDVLRSILEKTAFFLGYEHFGKCVKKDATDPAGTLHQRFVDILSHGKYSMFEPTPMGEQTHDYFLAILKGFVERHPFNPELVKEIPDPKN